jgi:ABC-type nitrate/sulfonate/bicarbonate transport system substrate-binding protein
MRQRLRGPDSAPEVVVLVAAVPAEGLTGPCTARDQGLFRKAGLKAANELVASSSMVIAVVLDGRVQVAAGQYTSYVAARAVGLARMRVLAERYSLCPRVQRVVVAAHSPVTSYPTSKWAMIRVHAVSSGTTGLLYTAVAHASGRDGRRG